MKGEKLGPHCNAILEFVHCLYEDFKVVRRVADEHRDQHIGVIEQEEARVKDHWMPILHSYLQDVAATQPMKSKEVN